jgi:hypothetical protein
MLPVIRMEGFEHSCGTNGKYACRITNAATMEQHGKYIMNDRGFMSIVGIVQNERSMTGFTMITLFLLLGFSIQVDGCGIASGTGDKFDCHNNQI